MWWRFVALACALLILFLTLTPGVTEHEGWLRQCLVCGSLGWADALRNIVLFLPLGFALRRGWDSSAVAIFFCLGLTVGIEATQTFVPGRDSNVGDILFNTLGGTIGLGLAATVPVWLWPRRNRGLRLAGAWGIGVSLLMVFFGWVLSPSLPDGVMVGQWTPRPRATEAYAGRLLDVRAGEHPLPAWYLPGGRPAVADIVDGTPVRLTFEVGAPPAGLSMLFRVVSYSEEAVSIAVADDDVRVRMRSRVTDVRLHDPTVWINNVLSNAAVGDTAVMIVWRDGGYYCARLESLNGRPPSEADRCMATLTAGRAWTLLVPPDALPRPTRGIVNWTWLAILAIPFGWWLGPVGGVAGGSAVAAVNLVVARATLLSVAWPHIVGLAVLGGAGGVLRAIARRLARAEASGE